MSADLIFEREKLREQLRKWKWLFVILLFCSIFLLIKNTTRIKGEAIARIRLEGVLQQDNDFIAKLKEIEEDPKIKAVILHIDSPGGGAFTGEDIYVSLKHIASKKPIVSVLGGVAASGGYMAALGSDYIIARNMTITGSIGALMQSFEMVDLAQKLGIEFVVIKSSPLKASPNPMERLTPEAKEVVMETIADTYDVFLSMLMQSRKMDQQQAFKLANGQVYTGKKAKELNLIDEIGGEEEALIWLENVKKLKPKMKIVDIKWNKPEGLLNELLHFFKNVNKIFSNAFNAKISA